MKIAGRILPILVVLLLIHCFLCPWLTLQHQQVKIHVTESSRSRKLLASFARSASDLDKLNEAMKDQTSLLSSLKQAPSTVSNPIQNNFPCQC